MNNCRIREAIIARGFVWLMCVGLWTAGQIRPQPQVEKLENRVEKIEAVAETRAVQAAVLATQLGQLASDVAEMKSSITWLLRAIVGAVAAWLAQQFLGLIATRNLAKQRDTKE